MQLGRCFSMLSLFLMACDGLKEASPSTHADDGGGSAGPTGSRDAAPGDEPTTSPGGDEDHRDGGTNGSVDETPTAGFGPGKYGALPSGYCCNDDSECRDGRCEAVGDSGKMCLDRCFTHGRCQRPPDFTAFQCDNGGNRLVEGRCRPTEAFKCISAAKFELGTLESGSCCVPTSDGWGGLECLGGLCVARGSGPWVCSNSCNSSPDCPKERGLICVTDPNVRRCVPDKDAYTCN